MDDNNIDKFYLSHLNYGGRGNKNRKDDAHFAMTREAMDLLFETSYNWLKAGKDREFVTGNNDADAVYFLHWVDRHFPDKVEHIKAKLEQWGGNASGVNVANIDNLGNVHPDTFWWHYELGNVKERPFSEIWLDTSDPLMAGLKQRPRPLDGRCANCHYQEICNGNTRVRAAQTTGNFWAEDPGCYLTDSEIA
jgi:radical SAM protein with 4Fe4S-binding SPASM domain